MKTLIETFLVKTYESNFSYGIKMIQLICIQYTLLEKQVSLTKYFY
jgi:hypothetical protein